MKWQAPEVRAWVMGVLAGVYQPRPDEKIWEWAERTMKIPHGAENPEMAGQPWTSAWSPYVRTVMDWFRLPGKCELFIAKSSQTGFTMAMLIVICWHIVHQPTNIGYCIDSVEEARKISKSRLKRWISENKILEEVGEDEDDMSNMTYFLRGMVVYLMGSYSTGAFRNKSLGIGILDELDAHPPMEGEGNTVDLMRSRLKRPRNAKLIGFSTPKLESGQTWSEYEAGTQEKYHCACPHCEERQPFEWSQLRFSGARFEDLAGETDLQKVKEEAYYECRFCQNEIKDEHKFEMMLGGEWVASNPKAPPGKRSMHISDLYSNFVTWGELAVEWLGAQNNIDKLRAFINQRLGEPFRQESGTVKLRDVLRLREKYERGTCPIVPVLTGLLVDVQMSTLKWMKTAFDRHGTMYVVDWGETSLWEEIEDELNTPIRLTNGEDMEVMCGLVDEGDGNRHKEVREFCQPLSPRLYAVKGRAGQQVKETVYPSWSWVNGEEFLTYHIDDGLFKSEWLFKRIRGADKNRDFDRPRLVLPWRVTEAFCEELIAEVLEMTKDKLGFPVKKWRKTGTNDYLDTGKYALALWTIMEPALREAGLLTPPKKAA